MRVSNLFKWYLHDLILMAIAPINYRCTVIDVGIAWYYYHYQRSFLLTVTITFALHL